MAFPLQGSKSVGDVMKGELFKVFLEFYNNGVINQSTNATFIAFVPKKRQANKM